MKLDLNELESDDGVDLPPFITRSTKPAPMLKDDPAWMEMREIFAKHEQAARVNCGGHR